MKVHKVTDRTLWTHTTIPKCPLCHRNIRAGQYTLRHRSTTIDELFIHIACLRPIVAGTPEDDADPIAVEAQFQLIRRQLEAAQP